MVGKAQLSLPSDADAASAPDPNVTVQQVYEYESAVIDWSHQVLNVLKHDSGQPLIDGHNPGPAVEIDFWIAKQSNLEYIHEQLNSDAVVAIQKVLAHHGSNYAPSFVQLKKDVSDALGECNDVSITPPHARTHTRSAAQRTHAPRRRSKPSYLHRFAAQTRLLPCCPVPLVDRHVPGAAPADGG